LGFGTFGVLRNGELERMREETEVAYFNATCNPGTKLKQQKGNGDCLPIDSNPVPPKLNSGGLLKKNFYLPLFSLLSLF
jgi:hypothetical protein